MKSALSPRERRVRRIYEKLKGAEGVQEHELWEHALYLSKTPQERCQTSLQAARLALSLRARGRKIPCILIGMMAAIAQGAPLMTVDYDLWVKLPERQDVRILGIVQRLKGMILARTLKLNSRAKGK